MSGNILFKPDKNKKAVEFYYDANMDKMSKIQAVSNWDSMQFQERYEYLLEELEDQKRYGIENAKFRYMQRLDRLNIRLSRVGKPNIIDYIREGNNICETLDKHKNIIVNIENRLSEVEEQT